MDHLAKTANNRTSRRRAVVLAPPSPEPSKACRSRACCNRQMGSRRAKVPKNQRTKAATIANDDISRLEESDMKLTQKMTRSQEISRTHDSTRPPSALGAPPERG